MTDRDINRVLAEKVMGWPVIDDDEPFARHAHKGGVITSAGPGVIRRGIIPEQWSPTTNRHDLAEVLAKLTDGQCALVERRLLPVYYQSDFEGGFIHWTHICDPRIIAQAVAEVVKGGSTAAS